MQEENTITILDVGEGWMAVEKPYGLSVHNDPEADLVSILTDVVEEDDALARELSFDPDFGVNAVHRLDRDTSGVILLACRKNVFHYFSEQFQAGKVDKKYTALVHGSLDHDDNNDWKEWNFPLARQAGGRKDPAGSGKRVTAVTRYRVLDESFHYSLLEISLLTGRKHQIRRHAKLAGHPLVCDRRYGSPKAAKYLAEKYGFSRLALHSCSLAFTLPDDSLKVCISTEKVPGDVMSLLNQDKQNHK